MPTSLRLRHFPIARVLAAMAAMAACTPAPATDTPAPDAFMAALAAECGRAFEGRVVSNEPRVDNDPFENRTLVMHVRTCEPGRVLIPFHVGEDRSRTWVITRTDTGLRLKHDHRHEDGSEDVLTMYGGDTVAPGTATRQEFPADVSSRELFERQNAAASVANVWAMEIEPGQRFVYELTRPERRFTVEFDLRNAVPPPPAPWGH